MFIVSALLLNCMFTVFLVTVVIYCFVAVCCFIVASVVLEFVFIVFAGVVVFV